MAIVDFRKHFLSKDTPYIVPQGCQISLHLYIAICEMEPLERILLATAVFQVVTCLMTLSSPTSTDLMTQGAIILLRRPGHQCLVTLMREWCVMLFICLYFYLLTAPSRPLLYTRRVVTRGRLLLIYMRTVTRFVTGICFPTTIMTAYRLVRCDTMKYTQVGTAGPLTQVVMVLYITSSLVV